MKFKEFFEWLDDFDRPTDTNWYRVFRIAFWVVFLAIGILSYLYLFSIFAPTY